MKSTLSNYYDILNLRSSLQFPRSSYRAGYHRIPCLDRFYICSTPPHLGDIVGQYNMSYHFYADDTQFICLSILSVGMIKLILSQVESCVRDIDRWMSWNKLKLNRDKTELLVISSKYWPRPSLDSILVGDHRVNRSDKARNIGVVFDETLSLDEHVSSVCKSALFNVWNIAKIRMYLTSESTKTLVHAYVKAVFNWVS